jgi:hypothetical protein
VVCSRAHGSVKYRWLPIANGGWASSVLQAPSTQLRASRQLARRSTGQLLQRWLQHMMSSSAPLAAAVHVCWSADQYTCRRLLAVQRGLPSRSFSSGGSQLIRVMVKESVAYTRAARQRCGTACARSHAHRAARDCYTAEHCCRPAVWRTRPPRTCSHPSSSPLMRSSSCCCTAACWAAGWACRQQRWSRRASMEA